MTERRVTVPEAAKILGISPEAVRARIKRGTLPKDKDNDGTVYVRLDADQTRYNGSSTVDRSPDGSAYIEELREQIEFLRAAIGARDEELRREREARVEEKRRHDTIVLQLAQRIPELEAPEPQPRGASETISEGEAKGTALEPQEPPKRRSWLYRFFFGP